MRVTSSPEFIAKLARSPDYAEWKADGKGLSSAARVARDGRINVSLKLKRKLPDLPEDYAPVVDEFAVDKGRWFDCPPLSIVIMIVGSRGAYPLQAPSIGLDNFVFR